jgi:hypothetical protein
LTSAGLVFVWRTLCCADLPVVADPTKLMMDCKKPPNFTTWVGRHSAEEVLTGLHNKIRLFIFTFCEIVLRRKADAVDRDLKSVKLE